MEKKQLSLSLSVLSRKVVLGIRVENRSEREMGSSIFSVQSSEHSETFSVHIHVANFLLWAFLGVGYTRLRPTITCALTSGEN